jgi:hypothetical protein
MPGPEFPAGSLDRWVKAKPAFARFLSHSAALRPATSAWPQLSRGESAPSGNPLSAIGPSQGPRNLHGNPPRSIR